MRIIDWFRETSVKQRLLMAGGVLLVILLIIGGVFWFSPTHKIQQAQAAQAALVKDKTMTDKPKGKFQYVNNATQPDLDGLLAARKDRNVTLRGQVSIPQYSIDVPIFEGSSPAVLAWGAGTVKAGQRMGQGNYAIQAHSYIKLRPARVYNWFFTNFQTSIARRGDYSISHVRPALGTTVYTLDRQNVYEYKIIKSEIKDVRNPVAGHVFTDARVNEITSDHKSPLLTMATCYEQYGILHPNQRIVISAQLVKTTPRSQFSQLHQVFSGV